ncbi:Nif3-like dinuclear metal center hexameric protein, partial [Campylobacter coli]|uniref:Nif3-like dinuclear metal center hexameric protein n=1 Tax=Campylobacter coli TaxID=195 RepID=UPI002E303D46
MTIFKTSFIKVKNIYRMLHGKEYLKRLAVCTGSGGDLLNEVKADCYLSGDFKYHQALEAIS